MANGRRVSGRPGTGFVGLSEWAAQNQTGANALAERLAGGVESEGAAAQQGLDNLESTFDEQVRGGTLWYTPTLNSGKAENAGQQGYTGPDALANVAGYNETFGAANRAGQNARRLGDLYGRATALQDLAGKGRDYSSGQQLLDSALAGRAGGSRFQQLGQQWGGLFSRAQGMERAASGTAREARAQSDDAARRYAERAPIARREEEAAREYESDAYVDRMNQQQEIYDRAHPETTGEDNRHIPRNRAREPMNKNALAGWGKGGSWA